MGGSSADRVIDFSMGQAHLSVRYDQLVIERKDQPLVSTPIDEIAVLVLANRRVTLTQAVLSKLMDAGGAVLIADEAMLPSGMMLPLNAHTTQTQRMIAQANASQPICKRIWQQIVIAKIRAQAAALQLRTGDSAGLGEMAQTVRSGDPENMEAQAAQRYWPLLFEDPDFRRRRERDDQNKLLNYGYAVLRAAVGRAICASGLHPSLGVHHRSRNNPFCLADDLMEPWRPLIDLEVAEMVGELGSDAPLDSRAKQRLVGVLHERLSDSGESRTVVEWISRSAASLARALTEDMAAGEIRLFFPEGLTRP
ncbi:MAG: type II CRISPR-associated endonuclease Cas1 [Leptolyngbya sp. PLA3]|nr:MAG: type II CRISPR-associated endonuclease Cas1 [Cyanobacteria bacterium CYA]MCE7969725.1 type II CRISPR-associated endonuclease Cas1 [Leptolyngbya sp. PL-A3]